MTAAWEFNSSVSHEPGHTHTHDRSGCAWLWKDDSAAGMRAISTDVAFSNLEFRQARVKFYDQPGRRNKAVGTSGQRKIASPFLSNSCYATLFTADRLYVFF